MTTDLATAAEGRYHRAMSDVAIILIAILVVVLVWRGPKTLPELGKALGRGIREARREATGEAEEDATKERPDA